MFQKSAQNMPARPSRPRASDFANIVTADRHVPLQPRASDTVNIPQPVRPARPRAADFLKAGEQRGSAFNDTPNPPAQPSRPQASDFAHVTKEGAIPPRPRASDTVTPQPVTGRPARPRAADFIKAGEERGSTFNDKPAFNFNPDPPSRLSRPQALDFLGEDNPVPPQPQGSDKKPEVNPVPPVRPVRPRATEFMKVAEPHGSDSNDRPSNINANLPARPSRPRASDFANLPKDVESSLDPRPSDFATQSSKVNPARSVRPARPGATDFINAGEPRALESGNQPQNTNPNLPRRRHIDLADFAAVAGATRVVASVPTSRPELSQPTQTVPDPDNESGDDSSVGYSGSSTGEDGDEEEALVDSEEFSSDDDDHGEFNAEMDDIFIPDVSQSMGLEFFADTSSGTE